MSKEAKKTLLACTIAIVLVVVSTASAEQKDQSDLWPLKRQQVLTGTYTGQLTSYTQDCQTVRAELFLSMPTPSGNMQRYTLKTTCIAGNQLNGPPRTITGAWNMDEAIGSCLVLNFMDVDDPMVGPNIYGFAVEEDLLPSDHKHPIYVLAQDGHNCHSGRSPEYDDKVLRRVR
ncbi:hypothetical protein [Xanthomonas arboricola]|uniref:hypothetical protein n=1 Tax=Xanthomonas arboricola TaxID=56448 RepID=UPI000CEDB641|nr:hypothetical protein [Xanthomonas arboricola]MBB6574550.1 hypothetical protein [Xanthomonas arboricola]PPT89783.1 hypothetical protein XarbCFBP8149_03080 [Xanthomonas arboricola]